MNQVSTYVTVHIYARSDLEKIRGKELGKSGICSESGREKMLQLVLTSESEDI